MGKTTPRNKKQTSIHWQHTAAIRKRNGQGDINATCDGAEYQDHSHKKTAKSSETPM